MVERLPMADQEELSREEKKDDFSLEKVPIEGRTMGWMSITNVTLGVATAMLFIQMGSLMAISFGAVNALLAEIYATIVAGVVGIGICFYAAKSGLNVNLMARGGGFGYFGASITSLIYALNFIMYCAIEGSIMAAAVHEYISFVPIWGLMVFFGLIVIPLNWFGIRQLDKLQKWSLPLFVLLLGSGFFIVWKNSSFEGNIWTYLPEGGEVGGASLLACIGIMNGLVGIMALLVSDYARFIKKEEFKIGVFAVGFLPQLICFFVMGVIGIWFGVQLGEENPGVYFVQILGIGGALFTILTQLRINITNLYSSSLSLANFFENVFKFKPGRNFWVVFTAVAAIVLMLGGVLDHLGSLLTFQGVFLLAWAAVLLCDAFVVKRILKIGPNYFEHRQEYLYAWNPVGVVSLIVSCVIGSLAAFGYMGVFLQNVAAFFAAIIAFVLTIVLAVATKGKYYSKKAADDITTDEYIA
ncbi:purine-cytosine permease family protein [Pseudobacillus badius]|uniref:purine-cytosine permease family protein n=1 Tax=Bacillus badius TaxID=1455 RepID=UPI0007B06613|nr:cytosine permease [Bacillus badius]KZO00060.1 permease [Bacillus badius]MED0665523.1 cytosine permease [Bacillus badius]OCS86221.1 permease [Bacillus badius]OVE52317.1 permease [Bacillus badius]TDW04043.1 purine-cytosine permease-like protein [Bacillus badius]